MSLLFLIMDFIAAICVIITLNLVQNTIKHGCFMQVAQFYSLLLWLTIVFPA